MASQSDSIIFPKMIFPKQKDPMEIIESFPQIDKIRNGLEVLDTVTDIQVLSELKETIFELRYYYCSKQMNLMVALDTNFIGFKTIPFSREIDKVVDRINQLTDSKYLVPIIMSEGEVVNGYKLFELNKNYVSFDIYQLYLEEWNTPDMTEEEFMKLYDETACTEWSKMDEHGDSYGGFWKFPKGTYENDNAWRLTRENNGECLWKLPYPKKFILHTIDIGCSNRHESVRFSNFICEWMKRKINQMNQ